MTITRFEAEIDEKILERGLDYYQDGQVRSLEFDGTYWTAEVSGSEDYTVTIEVSRSGKIKGMECDCPYDWGPVCKHEAAVLYALRDKGENALVKTGPAKMERLKTALEGTEKSRLITILLEIAEKNRPIRDELLMLFSGETGLLDSVRDLIKSSISSVMRRGFVEYDDVGMAVDGAWRAMEMAGSRNGMGDSFGAVSIYIVILREMMELLKSCDDSNGEIGDVISTAVEHIRESVNGSADDGSGGGAKLFTLVFDHAAEKIYDDWDDWRFEMLEPCVRFCGDPALRKKMETCLDSFRPATKDDFHANWTSKQAQKIRHAIIKKFDGPKAAGIYLEKNMEHNEEFRNIIIEKAIRAKDYDRALRLCLEAEAKYTEYRGLVHDYRRKRYDIYEKQKNIAGQKELGRAFVLGGDFDYYKKLKGLYTKTEWPKVLADLLKPMEDGRYSSQIYIDICIHEHFDEKLLGVCKKWPERLVELYPRLIPKYAADLAPVFTANIVKGAQSAGDRGAYQKVCELIRHYIKACGKPGAKKLTAELRETYCRRPAFIDELGKIKV